MVLLEVFGLLWATCWCILCTFSDVLLLVGVVNVYLFLFGVIYAPYDGKPQRHAYRDTVYSRVAETVYSRVATTKRFAHSSLGL